MENKQWHALEVITITFWSRQTTHSSSKNGSKQIA